MDQTPADPFYSEEETIRRRDAAVRRVLATPPQPRHGKGKESKGARPAAKPPPKMPKGKPGE
jgi:hypothetical protein